MNEFPKPDFSKMPKSAKEHLAAGLADYCKRVESDPVKKASFEKFIKERKENELQLQTV